MNLKQKCVKDICRLIVEHPNVILPDENISSLLIQFLNDQRTRHVYVVGKDNIIVGSVRLNDFVEFVSPYMQNLNDDMFNSFILKFVNKKISDIMSKDFLYLNQDTPLIDMVSIMLQNRVNELPVVDKDNRIIGEVNFMEFIKFLSDNEQRLAKDKITVKQ